MKYTKEGGSGGVDQSRYSHELSCLTPPKLVPGSRSQLSDTYQKTLSPITHTDGQANGTTRVMASDE